MYYLIYKITNSINGKFYIGAHRTEDKNDDYMGSGVLIVRAIAKYGKHNFKKEILCECLSSEEMFDKEREMVVVDIDKAYNIAHGGCGGNMNEEFHRKGNIASQKRLKELRKNAAWVKKTGENRARGVKAFYDNGGIGSFIGKQHTEETKAKMRKSMHGIFSGKKNPMHGMMWIYKLSTFESKRISRTDDIPNGWVRGRKMKPLTNVVP